MLWRSALFFVGVLGAANSVKILALFITSSHSHHFWNSQYIEALAARGHHITYLGLDKYTSPPQNVRHIYLESVYQTLMDGYDAGAMENMSEMDPFTSVYFYGVWNEMKIQAIIKDPKFKTFLEIVETEKFDLIITDLASTGFTLGAAARSGYPPLVGITAFGIPYWVPAMAGSPVPYTSPHAFLAYSSQMSFRERVTNYILNLFSQYTQYRNMETEDSYAKHVFGDSTKHIGSIIEENMNIVMLNWNLALDHAFATVPGMITIGGLHIKEPKQLPQDLQQLLDNAKDGVIYFSLGSNVQSSELQGRTIDIFKEAFKRLAPIKVLWKWEADELSGKPDNVEVRKWLPQNDILAHPNVRVFFTHSGLLSTQEAAYHGVPIVGMPFFLDQHVNIKKCVRKGVGEQLDLQTLTSEKVYSALKKVLDNPQYRDNMRNLSAIFKDNMNSPLERAIYWTEYAIRHKGAPHLRPGTRDLAWYQNWLLDVLFVVVVCPLLLLCLVIHLVRKLLTAVFTTRKIKKH